MARILTPENLIKYAETRLFGSNVDPDQVRIIKLYNGVLPFQLDEIMGNQALDVSMKVRQENEREPIFFTPAYGTLHIPQYSGFGRARRYEHMIQEYIEVCDRQIHFEVKDLNDDPRATNIAYDNNAYDFVAGLFVPDEKYEDRRVFHNADVQDIDTIIFGSVQAVKKYAKIQANANSEYLDAKIVEINGQRVLNIGYVYADQAGIIIDKMLREFEAMARSQLRRRHIRMFMFGRVGGLDNSLSRHNLVFPTGIVDDMDIQNGRLCEYPMHNILAGDEPSLNLNVGSVVYETEEQLQEAREKGCKTIDMELREVVQAVDRGKTRYQAGIDIGLGFVGYVSDLPLRQDTLADELDSDRGEQAAVQRIIDLI